MRAFPAVLTLTALTVLGAPVHAGDPCARPSGKKIDVSFRDAPLADAFRTLARVSGANLVLGDGVNGTITVDLRRVPWDQAMCAIAAAKKLRVDESGGIYTITAR